MPKISLVIPTYQREKALETILTQLSAQPTLPNEVIIVDQGTAKDPLPILAPLLNRGVSCSYLFSRYPAPASSRNVGINAATHPVILFIDDDIEFLTDLVAIHSRYYEQEPELAGVGGHVVSKYSYSKEYVFWNTFTPSGKYLSICIGANMSFRRDVLHKVGGFNAFLRFTGEEGELCHRIVKSGYRIRNGEEAVVAHLSEPGGTRSWSEFHAGMERIRDWIICASMRRTPWCAAFWPLKHWRLIRNAIRIAPSRSDGMKTAVNQYLWGLRLGRTAKRTPDFLPMSLALARGEGVDEHSGLPKL